MKPEGNGNLRFEIDTIKETLMAIGLGASGPSVGPSLLYQSVE